MAKENTSSKQCVIVRSQVIKFAHPALFDLTRYAICTYIDFDDCA